MALPTLPRHTRALLRPLQPAKLPRSHLGPRPDPRQDPPLVHITQVLHGLWLLWPGIVDRQHGLPHARFRRHGARRLLCRRRERHVRPVLHAHPHLPARPPAPRRVAREQERDVDARARGEERWRRGAVVAGGAELQSHSRASVDGLLLGALRGARGVSDALAVGLHVQHGRQHRGRGGAECAVDGLQFGSVSSERAWVDGVAGHDCRVGGAGDEPRGFGFPAHRTLRGCAFAVASAYGGTDDLVVSVFDQGFPG